MTSVLPKQQSADQEKLQKESEQKQSVTAQAGKASHLFDDAIRAQLATVFSKMTQHIVLKLYLDNRAVSKDLEQYAQALASLTDKITVEIVQAPENDSQALQLDDALYPCVRIFTSDGQDSGLAFHGAPGGHEFNSFILGLYNVAGPGQAVDEEDKKSIQDIKRELDIKVLVSLSCTMCPETVVASQRIASLNHAVRAEVYDINHFPQLKDQYQVMSVPCVVVNDGQTVAFGKKNLRQMLELIGIQ